MVKGSPPRVARKLINCSVATWRTFERFAYRLRSNMQWAPEGRRKHTGPEALPPHLLRAWDDDTRMVVIASMPGHRRNAAS